MKEIVMLALLIVWCIFIRKLINLFTYLILSSTGEDDKSNKEDKK